jgi:hypothetical protein
MRFTGTLAGEGVTYLLDSGATNNFVSAALVRRCKLRTQRKAQPESIELANGERESSSDLLTNATVAIGGYTDRDDFHVTNLKNHDVILGQTWLRRVNPKVDWTRGLLRIQHGGIEVELREACNTTGVESLMTINQAARAMRNGADTVLYFLKEAPQQLEPQQLEPAPSLDLTPLLREFADVFPDRLPPGLPPEREVDCNREV